jgi:hypothetical protein
VQDIIVVQQGDELARCQRKALIGVAPFPLSLSFLSLFVAFC